MCRDRFDTGILLVNDVDATYSITKVLQVCHVIVKSKGKLMGLGKWKEAQEFSERHGSK
jgi:hypothetical protein